MAISLPLVAWDTAYVLLRPHTMPGGSLHWPLWTPYALYGTIDGVYGFKAWHARDGFTAAQGLLNLVESVLYIAYLWLAMRPGARRSTSPSGRENALALLMGFSAAVMTLSKTVLYWAREYYADFDNIGHNDAFTLFFLWIIPNGAWLVGSTYMIFSLGGDILDRLTLSLEVGKSE
ncbi:hypothetical protein ACRALDRAFT_1036585 [Sodiomyces alcalophilus JCM 7366]|uniref:uncharacterized protein n=1 Tax=Sodiomyces alcalophilus JCM 7366 TaxID=591952 RepID=UPI0039B4A176